MSSVPTVKIASDDYAAGFVVINADEYDESVHSIYVAPPPEKGADGRRAVKLPMKPSEA